MKKRPFFKTLSFILFLIGALTVIQAQNQPREYYQLKTYTLANASQEALMDSYLKDAYLPALKRIGIDHVGVFKIHPDAYRLSNMIFVLIPFSTLDEFQSIDIRLANDKTYNQAGKDYIQASYDQPPYQRLNTVFMTAFEDMPKLHPCKVTGPREERIYELRSYESPTEAIFNNKVDMFNAGGEVALFDALGFNAVFYAEVIAGDKMPNLMYMTTFANKKSRDAHWKAFGDAPEWKALSSMPKYQNNVSHIDQYFLYPTAYSDY
ncbi:MAG: NIPSNAP family protein [Maribacter sp.]|uniref:NIPSNAP family protein n=1 Tax=Maribacter sp. TaxID=1897614 RepID=UPI003C788112